MLSETWSSNILQDGLLSLMSTPKAFSHVLWLKVYFDLFVPALLCFGTADNGAGWCLSRDDLRWKDRRQPELAVFANIFRAVEQEKFQLVFFCP
jgi:hypothetical protein